jgi:glutaredoxin
MTDFFNCLFHYLEKEEILIDQPEFLFQIQSHPNYPSLLAISDTLSFFNIDNIAARVQFTEIDNMPNRFITLLSETLGKSQLYFIEKKDNSYFSTKDKKTIEISKETLESRWDNIVLLAEKNETEQTTKKKKKQWQWVLYSLCIAFFTTAISLFGSNLQVFSFFTFPTIGILFSVAALKDLFGTESKLINNFCNISTSTSCATIVNSDKWKIFKLINFSDLSMLFFTSQFLLLFTSILTGELIAFFSIQKITLLISLPVILASLYYQRNIEKKWCPICLAIIGVLLFEIIYLLYFHKESLIISSKSLILFGLVSSIMASVWPALKNIFTQQKELKEFQFKANRFLRNYEIFKNTLLTKGKIELPHSPLILGNRESKTQITIITNPFCGYCKETHEILEKTLEKHYNSLQVKIIIKTDIETQSAENKKVFTSLMGIYFKDGETQFRKALNHWFQIKNANNWIQLFQKEVDIEEVEAIYNSQNDWCTENDFSYTPAIFINGYEYPKVYERANLEFFINELIEDTI